MALVQQQRLWNLCQKMGCRLCCKNKNKNKSGWVERSTLSAPRSRRKQSTLHTVLLCGGTCATAKDTSTAPFDSLSLPSTIPQLVRRVLCCICPCHRPAHITRFSFCLFGVELCPLRGEALGLVSAPSRSFLRGAPLGGKARGWVQPTPQALGQERAKGPRSSRPAAQQRQIRQAYQA